MLTLLRRNMSRLRLFAGSITLAFFVSVPVSADAETRAKDGLYNRKHDECNLARSDGGWHMASSLFSGFANRMFGLARGTQFYVYLIHDPATPAGFTCEDMFGLTKKGQVFREPSKQIYRGQWPTKKSVVDFSTGPEAASKPRFGIKMDALNLRFFVTVPNQSLIDDLAPLEPNFARNDLFDGKPLGSDPLIVLQSGDNPPLILRAARGKLLRETLRKRGGKFLPNYYGGEEVGRAYFRSFASYSEPTSTLRSKLNEDIGYEFGYSQEVRNFIGYLGHKVDEDTPLTVVVVDGNRTVYRETIPNLDDAIALWGAGVGHLRQRMLKVRCYR